MLTGRRGFLGQLAALVLGAKVADTLPATTTDPSPFLVDQPDVDVMLWEPLGDDPYRNGRIMQAWMDADAAHFRNITGSTAETYRKHWERARGS